MARNGKNLAVGIVIGAAAGFVAGILISSGKNKKTDDIRERISSLATDAQERIKALRAMAQRHETKKAEPGSESNSATGSATNN
jgi:gas vesicle protein